jgi:hypothetical protein
MGGCFNHEVQSLVDLSRFSDFRLGLEAGRVVQRRRGREAIYGLSRQRRWQRIELQ